MAQRVGKQGVCVGRQSLHLPTQTQNHARWDKRRIKSLPRRDSPGQLSHMPLRPERQRVEGPDRPPPARNQNVAFQNRSLQRQPARERDGLSHAQVVFASPVITGRLEGLPPQPGGQRRAKIRRAVGCLPCACGSFRDPRAKGSQALRPRRLLHSLSGRKPVEVLPGRLPVPQAAQSRHKLHAPLGRHLRLGRVEHLNSLDSIPVLPLIEQLGRQLGPDRRPDAQACVGAEQVPQCRQVSTRHDFAQAGRRLCLVRLAVEVAAFRRQALKQFRRLSPDRVVSATRRDDDQLVPHAHQPFAQRKNQPPIRLLNGLLHA